MDNARIEVEARTAGEGPAAVPEGMRFGEPDDEGIYQEFEDESLPALDFQVQMIHLGSLDIGLPALHAGQSIVEALSEGGTLGVRAL